MSSFRDRFFTPRVARAITSPGSILLAGAGIAVGIVGGLGVFAPLIGLGAVAARVLAAVPRNPNTTPDTRHLVDPWKSLLVDVIDSGRRFSRAVDGMRDGPMSDRLDQLGERLDAAITEAGRIASAGDQLSRARAQIDTDRIGHDMGSARAEPASPRRDQTVQAIKAQLDSAHRMDAIIRDTYERLRLLDARIDEMVARSIELSVTQADGDDVSGLGDEVESIVSDLESLRQAVEETRSPNSSPAMDQIQQSQIQQSQIRRDQSSP